MNSSKKMEIKGIVIYCYTHDDGAIILDTDNIFKNISDFEDVSHFNKLCGENCVRSCDWIKHGSVIFDSGNITYTCQNQNQYDDYCGGWQITYFENNVYDSQMNTLSANRYTFKNVNSLPL